MAEGNKRQRTKAKGGLAHATCPGKWKLRPKDENPKTNATRLSFVFLQTFKHMQLLSRSLILSLQRPSHGQPSFFILFSALFVFF